jgi:hypothetical protein
MIDTPAFDDVPEFSHDGTNVKPGTAKYSGGFVSNEMLPFDFFNWFMHGLTKNGAAEQVDIGSIHAELKSVLTAHGVTPNPALSNQLAGVFSRFIYGSGIYGSTSITDANSIVKSGFYSLNTPYTNGPTAAPFHILHIEWIDGSHARQIAYHYNNVDTYERRRNVATWSAWTKDWNASNDGSGSGLDADLLDGLDSSRFVFGEATNATIVYSTGSANNIAKSGFYRADTAVTDKPVAGACHIIHLQSTASADYATQFGVPQAGGSFYFRSKIAASWSAWVAVWSSANDGVGSGLEADTLDTYHAGHATGQIPVSDGAVNATLNAALVAGINPVNGNAGTFGIYNSPGTLRWVVPAGTYIMVPQGDADAIRLDIYNGSAWVDSPLAWSGGFLIADGVNISLRSTGTQFLVNYRKIA